jgi:hypothetical protein
MAKEGEEGELKNRREMRIERELKGNKGGQKGTVKELRIDQGETEGD